MASKRFGLCTAGVVAGSHGITGVAAAFTMIDGAEVGVLASNVSTLREIWERLHMKPLDESKVQKVAWFQAKNLTDKKRRKRGVGPTSKASTRSPTGD